MSHSLLKTGHAGFLFMKGIRGKWYITVFAAVMGFAAGAATELGGGYTDVALEAMGEVEGVTLLGLALTGMLLNGLLLCWCRIAVGRPGKIMSIIALWFKAMLMGLFCRELAASISGLKILLMALTAFGGGCVCAAMVMDGEDARMRAKRMAVWLCGVAVEGIIIPSIARTWALLFN